MRLAFLSVVAVVVASLAVNAQRERPLAPSALRQNIGKALCNATNGVFRGQIIDVVAYGAVGEAAQWVYVVERDGRRQNVPPNNGTVSEQCLPRRLLTGSPGPSYIGVVATEFRRRLVAYNGELIRLVDEEDAIRAHWRSQRCEMTEGEVVDFLISLHRGHPAAVTKPIEARRECEGSARAFRASANTFESYRAGKIGDPVVLRGLK